jgi:hypothetical protein
MEKARLGIQIGRAYSSFLVEYLHEMFKKSKLNQLQKDWICRLDHGASLQTAGDWRMTTSELREDVGWQTARTMGFWTDRLAGLNGI